MTPFNYIAESQSWDFLDSLNAGKESSLSNLSDVPQYSKVIIKCFLDIIFFIVCHDNCSMRVLPYCLLYIKMRSRL